MCTMRKPTLMTGANLKQKGKGEEEEEERSTYADTAGELHHFLSLDVLEAIDTGNTVSYGQHTTGFVDVDLSNSTENLLLEDGRNLRARDLG